MIVQAETLKNWEKTRLGEVCRIVYGKGLPIKQLKETGYPVFGANGIIGFNDKYLYEESQVLISCRGAYSGKINLSPPRCFVTNNSLILEINDGRLLDKKFLFFVLNSADKTKLVSGTAQPQVTINNAVELSFPLPPLSEQHRIVEKIEALFSELENGIEQLKTAQQQLKVYRQSVLKWAFEGKLASENVEWNQTTLGKVIVINSGDGLSKADRDDDGAYLVYGGNGVTGKHSKFMYEERKLIIGRVGAHCGNVHITKPQSWITDNAFVVSFNENAVDIVFLLHFIKHLNLNKYSSSTAQPVISQTKIYPIAISIPEKKEDQQQIVQEIESRLSVCDKLEETIATSLQQSEALRQSILKKAFEGRLVPQDPKDEPAKTLLEGIRTSNEIDKNSVNLASRKKSR